MAHANIVQATLNNLLTSSPSDDFKAGVDIYRRGWILNSTASPDVRRGFDCADRAITELDLSTSAACG